MMTDELMHHGIKNQKWGVKNGPPYPLDKGTHKAVVKGKSSPKESKKVVFVSGSSKTQSKDSEYYRKKLHRKIRKELKGHIKQGSKIIVGDAPGIDRQVQDYLNKKKYSNVEIYSPGNKNRYSANKSWKVNYINDKRTKEGSKAWLAAKDKAMTKAATEGLAVILEEGSKATRNNADRMNQQDKDVKTFILSKDRKQHKDQWTRGTSRANRNDPTTKDVNEIVRTMNDDDREKVMGGPTKEDYIPEDKSRIYNANILHRELKKVWNKPISFFDIWDDGDTYNIALGVRGEQKYRGKHQGTKIAKRGMQWYEKNKKYFDNKPLVWGVRSDNAASIAIAKLMGFKYERGSRANGWENYVKKSK